MQLNFASLFFILTMAGVVYIMLGDTPSQKIERGCYPVYWMGKFTAGVATAATPSAEAGAEENKRTMYQSCKFIAFKTFYADDYKRLKARLEAAERAKAKGE